MKKSIKKLIYRGLSILLIVTLLPFSSFVGVGTRVVEASTVSANVAEVQSDSKEPVVEEQEAQTVNMDAVTIYGGEDVDAFVNAALQGNVPGDATDKVIAEDTTLEADMTVLNVTLETGVLDLNGHTLFVYGSMLQKGGKLYVNGGRVIIMGDYRIQDVVEENPEEDETIEQETEMEYTTSTGILCMNKETDYLLIVGDFYTDSVTSHKGMLTKGIMEVKGDFYQYTTQEVDNFYSTGKFGLYLTGDEQQILQMSERLSTTDCIANLVVENGSEEGIILTNRPYVLGNVTTNTAVITGSIGVSNTTVLTENYFDGGIYMYRSLNLTGDLTVGEDFVLNQASVMIVTKNLTIKGDLLLDGYMLMEGGSIVVEGNTTIGSKEEESSYGFVMERADAYVLIKGDLTQKATGTMYLTGGKLEVQGDIMTNGILHSRGDHTICLSGETTQYVETQKGITFHILELANTSITGVVLGENVAWNELITNGCKLTIGANSGIIGYTLEADKEITGEFVLKERTLDLNGHTMTVTGDFIHSGGTVILNGGKLIIKGDYRKQKRGIGADGSYVYEVTDAMLQMDQEADHMLVYGDFYEGSTAGGQIKLTAGCLELKGDLYQSEDSVISSIVTGGNHTLLLSGDSRQEICFKDAEDVYAYVGLQNLMITNTSDAGVKLAGNFGVRGRIESEKNSRIEGVVQKVSSGSGDWGSFYAGDLWIADTVALDQPYELAGDLYFSGYLNVNADLTIHGSIFDGERKGLYYGDIYMKHATLTVHGDVTLGDTDSFAGIFLNNEDDYVLIDGDYTLTGNQYQVQCNKGTMEIKGNLRVDTPLLFRNGATMILSGSKKQCVSLSSGSKFAVLEIANTSEEGICYHSNIFYDELVDNGCKKQYLDRESMSGYTLSQDATIEGDVVLVDGDMDLNGKTLTIKGDLIQLGGTMNINGGRLIVEGGYYLGDSDTMWEDSDGDTSVGFLNMTSADDYVLVQEDFYITWGMPYGFPSEYYNVRSKLTAGVLEVKGDFVQKEGTSMTTDAYSFSATDDHVLLLSGDERQIVWSRTTSASGSHIANLRITNSSEEGVEFRGEPCVIGEIDADRKCHIEGYIAVASLDQIKDGYYSGSITNSGSMTIVEEVEIAGDFKVQEPAYRSEVLAKEGKITIGGDMIIDSKAAQGSSVPDEGKLTATGTYFHVKGDFVNESSKLVLTKGTLEVEGDYTDNCAVTYGMEHRVLLSGDKLQTIDTEAAFGTLELQNYSEAGVYSAEIFEKNELILNGCKLTIGDGSGQYGYTLEEDTLIAGDLTLVEDTLDLNGKTLTVRGDLILQNGDLKVNNGTLIVEGDLRLQTRVPDTEGYTYTEGYGHLLMENEGDTVQVKGDLILQAAEDISKDLTGGTIILNGTDKQLIESDEAITLHNLTIANRSEESVEINTNIYVTGMVADANRQVAGEGSLILTDINQIAEGTYGGNVVVEGESSVEGDVIVDGTMQVNGVLHLGDKVIRVGNLTVDGTLHTDTATLVVEEQLLVEKTGLFTMMDESYVLVKGKTTFSTSTNHTGYLTNGTLEMQGDFVQKNYNRNFFATEEHYTIFRRKNMTGPVVTQYMTTYGTGYVHFATLELTNHVEKAYSMNYAPEVIADEVIYITPGMAIPAPVNSIHAQEITVTSVTLYYDGVWEEGNVKGFAIYRDGEKLAVTNARTYTDTGLQPGTAYSYEVYPYNEDGNSPKESPVCEVTLPEDTTAPTVPEELVVKSRSGSSITLKWNKSKDDVAVEGYRLYRDDTLIYEGPQNEYKDCNLTENTLYTYYVKAYDSTGNESEMSESRDGVVLIPKIVSVTPEDYKVIGGDTVTLKVAIDNTGNSGNFTVRMEYYDTEKEKWLAIATGVIAKSQIGAEKAYAIYDWDITEVSDKGDVDVRLTVTDSDENTIEQIVTYTIDREAPEVPANVQAQDEGGTVTVNWIISKSADCAGYQLYRVNTNTGEGMMLADVAGRNSSWYSDEEIEDNTTYNYYLRAYDEFGNLSAMSDIAKVETGEDIKAPRVMSIEPSSGRINETTTLTITGKDNRAVAEYELYMRRSSEEEWALFATVDANANEATYTWDTTAYEEGNYYIKAIAIDANGNESEELFMRRYEVDNTGIAKIRLLPATAGSTTIQLEWEDVTEADFGYFIVEENVGGVWAQKAKISDKLGYRAENLAPETTHTYRVTGFDNLGNVGIPSDPVTVTTINDTTAPNIAQIQPTGSYYKDSIPLSMTVKDNAGVDYGVLSYTINDAEEGEFIQIATVEGTGKTTETLSHTWDISALPEGEVTVRFEAYDTAGIHNTLYEENQIENTYIIDRTAPGKVSGIEVVGNEGAISLEWDSVSDNDIASYEVERAREGENLFKKIKTTTNTLYYTDTDVKPGETYIYRIVAVDIAGNKSEASSEVYATVKKDEIAPVVTGISPTDEMIGSNPTLKVLAMDNARLQSIVVEYRRADSENGWYEIATIETSEKNQYKELTWDTDGLMEETVYEVRAKAVDAAGNESEYVTRSYTLDLTAPQTPELTVKSGSFCVEMSYSENTEEDFRCYKIYRREYGKEEYTCIQATIQNEFTDAVPKTDTTYYYKVRAYDIYGNYSESTVEHSYANHVDKIAPVAELPETVFGFTGMEVGFDGTMSNDNVRINRYEWDFGDGTTATGVRPSHTYEKSGTYNVTLTVRDAAGNEDIAYGVVQVMDQSGTGSAVLTIKGEDGSPLSGAYVYVKTGNGTNDVIRLRTNAKGEAKLICEAGVYEYAAFAEGYLPNESTIRVSNYETLEESITLEAGEVVTGELTVERMELDELLEKGVDLSAPENYHTFTFRTELWFASSPLPVVIDITENEVELPRSRDVSTGTSIGTFTQGNSTIQVALNFPESTVEMEDVNPTLTYIQTTQSVSWLKDMYDVELGIINNANSGYTITDASATLNLPDGMSLASTKSGQTLNTKMSDIDGQESASTSWVVRGDKPGKYRLSASFHGVLQPFEADINAQFETETECDVPAGEGIHIYVRPEDAYYPGHRYYIQFEIKNESNHNIYNLETTLGAYEQAGSSLGIHVKEVNTGKLIEYVSAGGMTYRSETAAKCQQIPVLYGGDVVNVGVLAPGESIYGTYTQQMDESYVVSGNINTTIHENFMAEYYYRMTNALVTELEGQNLGVEVTLEPIDSHIYKYILIVGHLIEDDGMDELDELMGDPIDTTTGAFLQDITTINLNGGSALNFNLNYNSMLGDYEGEAGFGWSHDYEQSILDRGNNLVLSLDSHTTVNFINEEADSSVVYGNLEDESTITLDGVTEYTGTYLPVNGAMEGWKIEKHAAGYQVSAPDGSLYDFDTEGRLIKLKDINNRSASINYGDNTMTIQDDITADTITVTYDEDGYISNVSDNLGRSVSLTHNGGNLTSVTGVEGKTSTFAYDSEHHMISATNAEGLTYVNNTFDEIGRVLTQKEAGKAGVMSLSYADTQAGGVLVTIDDGNGGTIEVESNAKGQRIRTKDVNGAETKYAYDRYANLVSETDALGNTVMYEYDEEGNLIRTYDTVGNITYTDYDTKGNPIRIYERDGAGTTFRYDAKNRLVSSVDPLGQTTRFAYDELGNLSRQVTDGKGILSYEYENGLLVSQTDAKGNKTTFAHDKYGNVVKMTDAQNNETLYTYSQVGNLLSQTDPDGTVTTHQYDSLGQKIKTTVTASDGSKKTERYSYDGAGRMTALTNALGETTRYSYDQNGNQTATIYPDGSKDTFVYDNVGNLIKKTTAAGVVTTYTYDLNHNTLSETTGDTTVRYEYYPNGKLYRQILPDGLTYTYTYDSSWNCILVMDSEGNSTGFSYDHKGNQTSVRDAIGNKTQYIYDTYGRCTQVIDPNGNKTTYSYDNNDNCIRVTDALGNSTQMSYDSLNRLTSTTQYKGGEPVTVSYTYDSMGRVTSITDEEGVTYHTTYDSFGNQVSITDGKGNITSQNTYDALNRVSRSTDALGNATAYSYDTFGNVTEIVACLNDATTTTTSYTYDSDGRIRSVTDELGSVTSQTYDSKGNVASVTDANGGTTTYSYDSMNRVMKLTNAIGATEEYTYNAEGLLAESKDNAGEKTTFKYDAAGRLISQKDDLGTITYTYDKNGNVLTVSDKDGTITREYDALNRVTSVTDYNGDTISYAYDELGNRISITYPGGEKVRYTYDKAGRMLTVTDAQGKVTYYNYDKNGRLIETKRPDGSRELCTYNVIGQLTVLRDETQAGEVINEYTYEYDGNGNVINITGMDTGLSESAQTSIAALQDNDPDDGITPAVENADGSITVAVSMTYDADNRLLTYNGQTVEYDAVGNMTRGPLNGAMADFTYDCRNRLVKVKESDGTITEYEYDAENIRTAVISGGIKTVYTTDRESTYSQTLVKTEYEKNTLGFYTEEVSKTTYTYGLGLIGERRDNNQEFYYHYNHIGSTMAVSDADGTIYYRYIYDTYGELSDITTDDGVSLKSSEQLTEYRLAELAHATGIDYLYNGQYGVETDSNGLYYMRARYYDQDIKRFINRDVVSGDIGNSQSLNRYCYVQGNPVSLTDPFGLCPDPNSAFKNFCKFLYTTDWSTIGHAALNVAGIFWDGADVINMFWYIAEGKWKEAGECAIYALPFMGTGIGSLLMKGNKAPRFGSALKTVSKLTQGSIGICMGADMAVTGISNIINGIDEGNISQEDIMMTLGGIAIATACGKSVLPSGGIKRIANSISDAYKTRKANKLNELAKQVRFIDADISHVPIKSGSKSSSGALGNTGEVRYREGITVNPMEVTYEMRLNPEEYAYAVADKYGINLRGSGQQINIKFDPYHTKGPGVSRELDPTNIILGPQAFMNEEELARTISHELNHARSWLKGGRAPEDTARAAENALGDYINGGR